MADLRITGKMLHSNRLTFETNDHDAIRQQLNKMMGEASYQGALVVLDTTVEQELIALIQLVVSLELQPIGVVDGLLSDQARAIQFPIVLLIAHCNALNRQKNKWSKHLSLQQKQFSLKQSLNQ